jgi:AraC-like DNA-binding protein
MNIDPQAVDLVRSIMPSPGSKIRRSTLSANPWLTQSTMECPAFMQMGLPCLSQSTCFHRVAGLIFSEENRSVSISDQRLARVMEYMQVNYARSLSIEDLSHEAGISKFHFVTVFRKKVGITPHRYLTGLRLNQAASLLQRSRSTIEQVARACGYGHAAQFTTAFTRYFDKAPSFFRKEGV